MENTHTGDERETLFRQFLSAEQAKGRRLQGLIGLRGRVPAFFRYLDQSGIPLSGIGYREALGYQGYLSERKTTAGTPLSANTVVSYVVAAMAFCAFLKTEGVLIENPFRDVRKVRSEKRIPRSLPREKELDAFLESLSRFEDEPNLKQQITRYKVHVISELLYASGLRSMEAASLSVSDVDLVRGIVIVREGKCGLMRTAFLSEYAREVLKLYITRIRPLIWNQWNQKNGESLFGLGWRTFSLITNRTLQRIGTPLGLTSVRSHTFRHALGFHLLRSGCPIRSIQAILGHRALRNTEVYTKVEQEDLKAVFDATHPRSGFSGDRR